MDIVIYHANCPDGLAGAWCFYRDNPEREFCGLQAGGNWEDCVPPGKLGNVIMVDVSGTHEQVLKLRENSQSLIILDHHKSAMRELENLDFAIFDMERSGAQIAWDYLYPNQERPWFIEAIGDRDLYKWEIPNSKKLCEFMDFAGVTSGPDLLQIFKKMTRLSQIPVQSKEYSQMIEKGSFLVEFQKHNVERICSTAKSAILTTNEGKQLPCYLLACDTKYVSDVGDTLLKNGDYPLVCMYRYSFENRAWYISARSTESVDLSLLMKQVGTTGGGHPRAGGCTIPGDIHAHFELI